MNKLIRILAFVAFIVLSGYSQAAKTKVFDICVGNESQFLDFVGGAALGSAITASVAGQSVLLIVTNNSALIVVVPGVTPALATTAVVASSAYVFMKGYCNSNAISNVATDLHQAAMDGSIKTIGIVAGTYRTAVDQTSEKVEAAAKIREIAVEQQSQKIEKAAGTVEEGQREISDLLCDQDPKCK